MIPLLESPFAQRLAWTLLHFLWQGALAGLAAGIAFTALRRGRPQLRYLAGCALLLACLGSAIATFFRLAPPTAVVEAAPGPSGAPLLPEGRLAPAPEFPTPAPGGHLARPVRIQPYLPWIFAAWLAGVLALGLRTAGAWVWLRRVQATAAPIEEPGWLGRLVRTAGIRRAVRLLESARVATPMCLGLVRPVILLPLGFFANLDPLAAEAVLAHELAHIRRLDALVNAFQCGMEVLFFFHPAVWWISRRIRTEREHCCDDAAVLACGDAVLYAETLSRLDALRQRLPAMALPANGGNLMERMRRLLQADQPRFRLATPGLGLLAALALVCMLPARAGRPQPPRPEEPTRPLAAVPDAVEPVVPLRAAAFSGLANPAALSASARTSSPFPLSPDSPGQARVAPAERWSLDSPRSAGGTAEASQARAAADAGPTLAEAKAYVQVMADHALWGPRTEILRVEVRRPARWYSHLTARWPRGEDGGATLEGWEIGFWAKPSNLLDPHASLKAYTILVDPQGVVHWRTLAEWDPLENRLARPSQALPPTRTGPGTAATAAVAGAVPTEEEARRILQAFADQQALRNGSPSRVLGVRIGRKQRWNGAYLGRWPEPPGKPPLFQAIRPVDGWLVTFQLQTLEGAPEPMTVLLDRDGVIHWRKAWPSLPSGLGLMDTKR